MIWKKKKKPVKKSHRKYNAYTIEGMTLFSFLYRCNHNVNEVVIHEIPANTHIIFFVFNYFSFFLVLIQTVSRV